MSFDSNIPSNLSELNKSAPDINGHLKHNISQQQMLIEATPGGEALIEEEFKSEIGDKRSKSNNENLMFSS